ncbi:hypothetical protein UA08_04966 [Talaromyces atroroseus]|uniref:AB hydrolase-1 domain-containing protein n=1 Tax=Talaromyces atroroseus TaxID=1441469 RepID=A0A225AZJ2_TALAT|nr:hypothetical protein UA08_04966 [Talaromyces atroroseus]OKL59895.1 hypothetical protein UA08_04966 [Talaromyces atroroseus]
MDEKCLPGGPVAIPKREGRRQRQRHRTIIAFVLLCLFIAFKYRQNISVCENRPRTLQYDGEHITWELCGDVKGTPVECSKIDVPMDQFDSQNSDDRTFSIPIIRMRGQNATQNLLLNPGGPGGSGLSLMHRAGSRIRDLVGEGFHLVSFDPRGVNNSTPQASCYPDASTRQKLKPVRSQNIQVDSPEVFAWAQNFVKACYETMGEYAMYINTPQTAADMNSILDALGQRDMVYWGFSYGTLLGQTYATMFPERSKRIIIDGAVDQFEWYGLGFDLASSLIDTDAVLDGFFDLCIKEGSDSCSLALLADSKEELRGLVLSYMEELQKQPIGVYIDNGKHGLLTFDNVWYNGVFPSLYKPQTWSGLADNLYDLLQGNATRSFLAYGDTSGYLGVDDADSVVELNDGLTGPDYWPQDRQSLLDYMLPFYNNSLFDASQDKIFYQRQQWSLPKGHLYVPQNNVTTTHPLLILSTTYDPVCPLIAARSANRAFVGSQIIEVKGYGHCSIAVASLCVAKHLRGYLYEGKVPETYTQCEVDSSYFVRPDETGKFAAQAIFEDSDDREIHLAQLELAREWDFGKPYYF